MLALFIVFQYSSEQAKVTKTNKLQKNSKKFFNCCSLAIRYPPQQRGARASGFLSLLK